MSVIAISIPVLLINLTGAFVPALSLSSLLMIQEATSTGNNKCTGEINKSTNQDIYLCDDVAQKLVKENYETMFVDKDTLIKTLEQYNAKGITIRENEIFCHYDNFMLTFFKENPKDTLSAFKLKIEYTNNENINTVIKDLSDEYLMNAQEASYNKIKKRLDEKNLQIEQEEILEDNTIVLTVNLE